MKLIDRYISRLIVQATGVVMLVVCALVLVMLFINQVDDIGEGSYTIPKVIAYVVMILPGRLLLVMPVIALLGALMALGALSAGSELVVIRSAGVSMARLAWSVSLAGIAIALVSILLSEYLGPGGVRHAHLLRDKARHGMVEKMIDNGLWLRQGDTVLRVEATQPGGRIRGLTIYRMNGKGRLEESLTAPRARLKNRKLVIQQPSLTKIGSRHTRTAHPNQVTMDVNFDPKVFQLAVTKPRELSSYGLWQYINYLKRNEIDASDYSVALWRNIVTPFTIWIMVVFALPFAFGSLRSASAGQRLFLGGLIGLVFFLVNEIFASTAPVYGVAPWLAASLPTALLGLATVWWIRKLS